MEIQLGAVKRIHGLLKTEAESYEGLLGEGCRRASCAWVEGTRREPGGRVLLDTSCGPCLVADPQPGPQHPR